MCCVRIIILSRYPLQLLAARWLAVGFPLLSGLGGKVALRMGVCDRVVRVVFMLFLAGMSSMMRFRFLSL